MDEQERQARLQRNIDNWTPNKLAIYKTIQAWEPIVFGDIKRITKLEPSACRQAIEALLSYDIISRQPAGHKYLYSIK